MARSLSFTYASLVIGAGQSGTTYRLTGKHSFTHDYERASLSFEVVVQDAEVAVFLAAEAALLAAYRKPDQALVVILSATNRHSFDPAANTGFNARANARIIPGVDSTDRSARYLCTVTVELPANLSGRGGRRSSSVNVATSPSGRKTLTVSGVYTALSNNAARVQFQAEIATYCSSLTAGLGGTWENVGTPTADADDQNKTIRFTRVMRQVRYNQALGVLDHPAIVDPRLTLRRSRTSAGPAAGRGFVVEPLREITAEWAAAIDFDQETDLDALLESTVRPWILSEAERVGGGTAVVVRETPAFDPNENLLSLSMTFLVDSGAAFLSATAEVSDNIDLGVILKPVWDGNPFSRDRYQGSGSHVRTYTRRTKKVAGGALVTTSGGISRVVSDHGKAPEFAGFVEVREARRARGWNEGLPGTNIPVRASETTYVYVRADEPKATTSGTTERARKDDDEDETTTGSAEAELL